MPPPIPLIHREDARPGTFARLWTPLLGSPRRKIMKSLVFLAIRGGALPRSARSPFAPPRSRALCFFGISTGSGSFELFLPLLPFLSGGRRKDHILPQECFSYYPSSSTVFFPRPPFLDACRSFPPWNKSIVMMMPPSLR